MIFPWNRSKSTGRGGPLSANERKWAIFWSYLPEWILTIFLWGIFYLLDKIDGYRRLFDITDTSLAHPYAVHERVPVWLLAVICGVVPAVLIALVGGVIRKSFWDVHAGLLELILSLGLTVTFTDIVKITAGRPRPDLFSRCQPPPTLTSNPVHGLTSWTVCTQTDLLQDGFRSFPSGHSSFAWCGMIYLILYMAAKMRISNRRGYTYKSWILLLPLSCAALVSVTRTMDYRHHSTDVIAGAIAGLLAGRWGYRQYYPPLAHPQAYKPYSPRIAKEDSALPLHAVKGDPNSRNDHYHNNRGDQFINGNEAYGMNRGGAAGYQDQIRANEMVGSGYNYGNGSGNGDHVHATGVERERERNNGLESEEVETVPRI